MRLYRYIIHIYFVMHEHRCKKYDFFEGTIVV